MPLTDRDVERRLKRNENDVVELYTMLRDVQRTVTSHDQRFDSIDQRLDGMDARFDAIDQRFDAIGQRFDEVLRRLPEVSGS